MEERVYRIGRLALNRCVGSNVVPTSEQSWTLDGYDSVLPLLVVTDKDEPADEDMEGSVRELKNI
jgi:hypothetical protein